MAWKILRGAVEASTKSVTVGVVADQADTEKMKTQTNPEIRESFIGWLRIMAVLITASGMTDRLQPFCRILDFSRERGRDGS